MKKQIVSILSVVSFMAFLVAPALADDLEALEGSWSTQKTNDEGQRVTQHIEIKKKKFTFKIVSADHSTLLYAEGDVQLEKAGPFKTIVFSNIKAGESSSDASPIDDTYTVVYKLADDVWTVISNLDKERDQKPSLDVYRKSKSAAPRDK